VKADTFYLGTHRPHWLETSTIPLFISHRQLASRRTLPRAATRWALDSGGFTELTMHGRWVTPTDEYVAAVERYEREVGNIVFAAPQDWMCEPAMLARTGLTVREHQERTVANYLELRGRGPFIPVLQGWTIADYERCVALYADAGVNLYEEPLVGLGTVCRRENAAEIGSLVRALQPLRLHGFGVKKRGLERYGHLLTSADSMAWSFRARRSHRLPGCEHRGPCANCRRFAMRWRDEVCTMLNRPTLFDPATLLEAAA
jgi:hypothetical protein